MLLTVITFALVYAWLVFGRTHRAKAVWAGVAVIALLPLLFGMGSVMHLRDVFIPVGNQWAAINWNVIGIFAGTFLVAEAFIHSRVPVLVADLLIERTPNVCWAALATCLFASAVSAVADNVATVLIVAPVAIALARRVGASPAPFLVGIAVSSNLQGTATLIGDPPSMILAARCQMNFNDFIWIDGRPGIFFAVQVGAVAGFTVLWWIFRKYTAPIEPLEREKVRGWTPTIIMAAMITGLALASLVDKNFLWFGGTLCVTAGTAAWIWLLRRERPQAVHVMLNYDFSTTFFLGGVFMLVYALEQCGAIGAAATGVAALTGESVIGAFLLVVGMSLVLSAFVDNIPYLAAMLPLVVRLSEGMPGMEGNMLLPFGLLIGACLGGNITPVGASANIVAYGMIHKEPGDEDFSFMDFARIGLPFTLAAVTGGALFLWATWMWM